MTVFLTISLALALATVTLAATETSIPDIFDACVITNSSCTCAMQTPSGTCMRHQGDGACLMGQCNNGYKCDCMGFEQCAVSNCSIYTTTNLAVPSELKEFPCQLTPSAGKCITFETFLDTVDAVDSAKTTSTAALHETTTDLTDMTYDQAEMLADKAAVDDVLEQLDVQGAGDVTEEERAEVDSDSLEVSTAIAAAHVEAGAAQADMTEALEADLKAAKARRVAHRKAKEAVAVEEEEKVERSKPKNVARIRELRRQRREAVIEAGTWVTKSRGAKDSLKKRKKNVKKIKLTAREARERCVARSLKILKRLNRKALQG